MAFLQPRPLNRAEARCTELEAGLRKSPDFQLYLLTRAQKDRMRMARMEHLLMEIPEFKLWHTLRHALRQAKREATRAVSSARAAVADTSQGARPEASFFA